jgi:hypothetical protein
MGDGQGVLQGIPRGYPWDTQGICDHVGTLTSFSESGATSRRITCCTRPCRTTQAWKMFAGFAPSSLPRSRE